MRKNSLILTVFLLLALINITFAIPLDLTTETYITPAYGLSLQGYYYYSHDGSVWNIQSDNYELDGYYHIFNSLTDHTLIISGEINNPLAGTVYLCVRDIYNNISCTLIDSHTNTVSSQAFVGSLDLNSINLTSGRFRYYVNLAYNSGSSSRSWEYQAYYNIESAYQNKRQITVFSSNTLNNGLISIILNKTITNELNSSGEITYDIDLNETTFSGTKSSILITNSEGTKAYPYYIENWQGGFYSYSRFTSNTTVIKVFVNENVSTKGLVLYYNISTDKIDNSREGIYNYIGRTDDNNNPFNIFQVFSDYRWNQIFFTNITNLSYSINIISNSYNRNDSYIGTLVNGGGANRAGNIQLVQRFKNNVTSIFGGVYGADFTTAILNRSSSSSILECVHDVISISRYSLINSSGFNLSFAPYGVGTQYYNVNFQNNLITLNETGNVIYRNSSLNESVSSSYIYSIGACIQRAATFTAYILPYSDLKNISSTINIFNSTNTTPLNTSSQLTININSNTPVRSLINIIPVQIDLSTNLPGVLTCFDYSNNISFGTIQIPQTNNTQNYNIIFNYEITNKTYFYLNTTEFIRYYCTYTTLGNVYYSSDYITTFGTTKLFLSNIRPIHYNNYLTNSVLHTTDFDYSFDNTSYPLSFNVYLAKLKCNYIYQSKCISWVIDESLYLTNNTYYFFGIPIYSTSGFTNPVTYSNTFSNYENGKCYLTGYIYNIANVSTIYSNLLGYRIYCINGVDNSTISPTNQSSQIPQFLYDNAQNCYINFTPSVNNVFMHPDCATGSVIYILFNAIGKNQVLTNIILAFLIVFWNFTFLAILIGIGIGVKFNNMIGGLAVGLVILVFFIFSGLSAINFVSLMGLIILGIVLYLKKRN